MPANGADQSEHLASRNQSDQPQQIERFEAGDNGQGESAGPTQCGRERKQHDLVCRVSAN